MPVGIRSDPAPSYKYGVVINGALMAGFTSCTGLEVSRETQEVVEGGINDHVHVLPGRLKYSHLTLKRGIILTSFMWEWLHVGMYDVAVKRMPITIVLFNLDGTPARTWAVSDAYPVKWSAGELRSDSNEVAVETVEFAHSGLEFIPGGAPAPM